MARKYAYKSHYPVLSMVLMYLFTFMKVIWREDLFIIPITKLRRWWDQFFLMFSRVPKFGFCTGQGHTFSPVSLSTYSNYGNFWGAEAHAHATLASDS